ncbi:MAG: hypothetical protein SNH28_04295 [Rikenellaceae bacterium]
MKKIKIFGYLTCAALLAVSCSKDYVEPDSKTKSFGIISYMYSGESSTDGTYTYDPYRQTTTNSFIGFKDISQGYLTHEWKLYKSLGGPEYTGAEVIWEQLGDGEAISFIQDNIDAGYSSVTDWSVYYDPSITISTDRASIVFVFDDGGYYKLQLRNTYDTQITWLWQIWNSIEGFSETIYKTSSLVAGTTDTHEVIHEQEFLISKQIAAAYTIYSDPSWTKVAEPSYVYSDDDGDEVSVYELATGESLYFDNYSQTSDDDYSIINTYSWSIYKDGVTSPSYASASTEDFSYTFTETGVYTMNLTMKRSANGMIPETTSWNSLPLEIVVTGTDIEPEVEVEPDPEVDPEVDPEAGE